MAGISILLMNLWLFLVLGSSFISLIFLIISIISKKKKKIISTITLIISIVCSIPLIVTIILMIAVSYKDNINNMQKINELENKITVDGKKWEDGFNYNGDYLIPVTIFINSDNYRKNDNLNKIGALVYNSTSYHSLYEITNNSGFKIYYVWVESFSGGKYYSRTFVNEKDYENILNYYTTANYKVKSLWKTSPNVSLRNTWKSLDLNINNKAKELINLSHDVLDNAKDTTTSIYTDSYDDCIDISINSEDGVYTMDFSIYVKDNKMSVYLNDYKLDDNIINKYNTLLNYLLTETEKEINQN